MPLFNHCLAEKQSNKKDLIWLIGSSSSEIVLKLWVKTIAVQI